MDELFKNFQEFIYSNKNVILKLIPSDDLINTIFDRDDEYKFLSYVESHILASEIEARGLNNDYSLRDFDLDDITSFLESKNIFIMPNEVENLLHEIINKKSLNKNIEQEINLLCNIMIGRNFK